MAGDGESFALGPMLSERSEGSALAEKRNTTNLLYAVHRERDL
jgi:hypothetical protein